MNDDITASSARYDLWMTISELAENKGLGRSAVSERIIRLEQQGLLTTRPGKGRQKLVNLVEFDRVVGQVADLGREQGAATKRGAEVDDGGGNSAGSAYTREQARRMAYLAEMARLDLEERKGELMKVSELRPIIIAAGEATARAIDTLISEEDALRSVFATEDGFAIRMALKKIANRIRTEACANLRDDLVKRRKGDGQISHSGEMAE